MQCPFLYQNETGGDASRIISIPPQLRNVGFYASAKFVIEVLASRPLQIEQEHRILLRPNLLKSGEGCANLLETGALSCNTLYAAAWKRDVIDYTELASKRWVEKLSMDRIAAEMDWGRTAVIRHLGKIRANPGLVEDGQVRLRIHRRKYKFMGS